MSTSGPAAPRHPGFDALSVCALLFGVVAHVGLIYSSAPANPLAPVKDAHRSGAADWLVDAAGLFHLPAFFLASGFFAGRLVSRQGERPFLRSRGVRLMVPLVLGWAIGFPVLRAAFAVATGEPGERLAPYPMHLWFLEYLLIYSCAGVLVAPRLGPLGGGFRWLLKSGLLPLAGAACTAPLLALSATASFGAPLSFVPDPVTLVVYGMFFAAGWGLFANADRLAWLGRWGCSALLAGVLLAGLVSGGGPGTIPRTPAAPAPGNAAEPHRTDTTRALPAGLPHAAARAAITWLLTFGLAGVCFRHLNGESRALRYLSGASFWLYLAHVPVLAWVGLALRPLDWPGDAKLALAALSCVCLLLVPHALLACLRARAAELADVTRDRARPHAPAAAVWAVPADTGSKEILV